MHVFMSWARSTFATVDHRLGRTERHFDALLVAVMLMLALASAVLFSQ